MAFIPSSNSVVSFQSDPTKLQVTASVAGTVNVGNFPGSVVAFQGTSPWIITGSVQASLTPAANQSVSGTVQTDVRGSVATVIIGGSIAASFTPPANQSVSGTVGANLISSNASVISVVQGSVAVAIVSGSIAASFTPPANQSVSGAVNVSGSVVAFQGAGWSGSVAAVVTNNVNVSGSVAAFQTGTYNPSAIAYLYRNDTLASTLGADQTYHQAMGDSAGRLVIKPFVSEDSTLIDYVGSVVSTSVTLIAASIIGKKAYITDFYLANTGSVATLVTWKDGSGATLGFTIAPGGGGSNAPGMARPIKTAISQDLTFQAATATSVLYLTVKGYQAP